jgi:hypothetical protein
MARAHGRAPRPRRAAHPRPPRPLGRRLPLAKVLEGGTWAAGRRLAQRRRGGEPPLRVVSDGTVF